MRYDKQFSKEVIAKERALCRFGVKDRFGALALGAFLLSMANILKIYNVPWAVVILSSMLLAGQNLFILFALKKNLYQRWMRFLFPVTDAVVISISIFYTGGPLSPFFVAYFLGIVHNATDMGIGMSMYVGIVSFILYVISILFARSQGKISEIIPFNEIIRVGFLIYLSFISGVLGQRAIKKARKIRTVMFEVENGKIDVRVTENETDEFGFLAFSFNNMMESLENAKKQADAIANDDLDAEILKTEFKGEFGKSFEEMKETLMKIVDVAQLIAEDKLEDIEISHLNENGTLSGAFKRMVERFFTISLYLKYMKEGRLNFTIEKEFSQGNVGSAISENLNKFREIIGGIKESSFKLSGSSTEVLSSSEELNSGATESAASIEETTSTVEEFATTSKQIMENSNIVSSYAEDTLKNGIELEKKIEELLGSMNDIKDSTMSTTDRILKLGDNSKEISNILNIIEEIAVQTKLLALNASIEAVGAGEYGKRFGVVADEIKNLAESVNNSTKKIKDIVETIKTSIEESVVATESQIKDVNQGVNKLVDVKTFAEKLKSVMEKTSEASKQIKLSTLQQKTAGDQLLEAMKDIASVANQSASSTKQLVSLVENLNLISENLKTMSEYFEI